MEKASLPAGGQSHRGVRGIRQTFAEQNDPGAYPSKNIAVFKVETASSIPPTLASKTLPVSAGQLSCAIMNPANVHLRRATVDDLAALRALWKQFGFNVVELEKHLTEFQLIETPDGQLLGALGFRLAGKQGLIHSEAYAHPEEEAELRARLWERLQNLARNHGLVRFWSTEAAPFWHQSGFEHAAPEDLEKVPASFGNPQGQWRSVKLREETAVISLEKEFDQFKQANQESSEKMLRQARVLKLVAGLFAFAFFLFVAAGIFFLVRKKPLPRILNGP